MIKHDFKIQKIPYRNFLKLNLNLRLFFITTFGIITTMLLVIAFTYSSFNEMIEKNFHRKIEFIARQLASSAILALAFQDKKSLEHLAKNVLQEDDITAIKIYGKKNKILLSLGDINNNSFKIEKKIIISSNDESAVFFQNPKKSIFLGRIEIYYTNIYIRKKLKDLFLRALLISFLLALIIDLILYFLVSKAITEPLKDLVGRVKLLKNGNLQFKPLEVSLPEVQELSNAFADMVSSLAESRKALAKSYEEMLRNKTLAEVGHFSLLIAHEIKNPLGIIKGALDILKKDNINLELKKQMITYIEEEVSRINDLIQNFLTFARPKKIKFQEIDLNNLLIDIANKLNLDQMKKIHLLLEEEYKLIGDQQWIERIFINLIQNAFEVGAKNIWIKALKTKNELTIYVWDDGPGIPKDKREKVFKPFYTEKIKGGVGLGLAIVEQIISLHKGTIEVGESEKRGALFIIKFPLQK